MVNLDSLPPPLLDSSLNTVAKSNITPPPLKHQESEKQTSTPTPVVSDISQKGVDSPQSTAASKIYLMYKTIDFLCKTKY